MFAKLKNLHISSFQKLCLRHQNIPLHGLNLEFHPLGAEKWIHFWCSAPHIYLKWFQAEFCDLFLSHPLQRLHHQMPLLWYAPGWGLCSFLLWCLMSMGSFHPSIPHQNTPDTTLDGPHLSHSLHHFLVLHTLGAGRNSYTLKQAWQGGWRKGEKCLEITFGTRILYHTSPSHCFSHPGERKGLCSKPQS